MVYNILAAELAPASAWAFRMNIIETGIRNLHAVAGRFQRIDQGQPFLGGGGLCAHGGCVAKSDFETRASLTQKGGIITLFGCGGSREPHKRPIMGETSGKLSDLTILTSDNPRQEDPLENHQRHVWSDAKSGGK